MDKINKISHPVAYSSHQNIIYIKEEKFRNSSRQKKGKY